MQKQATEKELLTLEKEYWQAMKDKDGSAAMRLTDDSCLVAGPQGVSRLAAEQIKGMLNNPSYEVLSFELDEPQVQMLTDDVAVVAYQVHEELMVDGEPMTLDCVDASTWVRRDGRWVCALHTECIAGDPFGRDRDLDA